MTAKQPEPEATTDSGAEGEPPARPAGRIRHTTDDAADPEETP